MEVNKVNHQYSKRLALPLKSTNFLKHILNDWKKLISSIFSSEYSSSNLSSSVLLITSSVVAFGSGSVISSLLTSFSSSISFFVSVFIFTSSFLCFLETSGFSVFLIVSFLGGGVGSLVIKDSISSVSFSDSSFFSSSNFNSFISLAFLHFPLNPAFTFVFFFYGLTFYQCLKLGKRIYCYFSSMIINKFINHFYLGN